MSDQPLHRVTAEEYEHPGDRLERTLEEGNILLFEPGRLPLPSEEDLHFLRSEVGRLIKLKNISYHPHGDYISGMKNEGDAGEQVLRILREHSRTVNAFLGRMLPGYATSWSPRKVNFRPVQEKGRVIKRHSNNELLHVDAFPAGATHGWRPLRFFTNINPDEARIWRIAEQFRELYQAYGGAAGIAPAPSLRQGVAERAWSGALRGLSALGLPQLQVVGDTSPYDRAMRRMHNWMKDSDDYQNDPDRGVQLAFEPFHSWCVFTDLVSHAALAGQHALVATYYVKPEACHLPERSPWQVLEQAGQAA
ncbi:Kdo hydroxylase family protein [Alkalilimnicola ehrlichii MLHE-1]|uniref:3-deoxy-D-manno-oct-2-ulosonic acid (Kdo) hydroxylase n=1 Tax=Alkalilimnicola ehrlichii (strain ATCC BAA-1101 / DSM 17681 / MLHE-1) TaxID=187272 RepID=Q0A4T9_ALKEH|nr:Kdo hydroxylase family protein [Alkalilimnicola ehrlichii]ABI58148.1 conserved hypothetical protein [Alkalilimnicola ehrlichii MLHE-1]